MDTPPVVLFGYDASAFTQKMQLVLRLKQIPYTYVQVPTMMPRPLLKENFGITYRRIPILSVGKDFYCDTSLIAEALEHQFPHSAGYRTLYPLASNGRSYRSLVRGFASYWSERPFYRVMTGLLPPSVWRSSFGTDRGGLVGHKLDPDKLEKKLPQNLSGLDMHLSMLESVFDGGNTDSAPWIFDTPSPSLADVSWYFMLRWGERSARGEGIAALTEGGAPDASYEGTSPVFNKARYPGVWMWAERMAQHFNGLPATETRLERGQLEGVQKILDQIREAPLGETPLLPTPAGQLQELDERNGLAQGAHVVVTPDDNGRNDPVSGTMIAASPEEVVITPDQVEGMQGNVDEIRVHFPRLGFVVTPLAAKPTL